MANRAFWSNQAGVPRILATSVSVSTTAAVYNFSPEAYVPSRYSGLILFKLPSFTAPSTAVPIIFNTAGNRQALTRFGGAAVTSADLNAAGIILCYYEDGTLQLLSSITTS